MELSSIDRLNDPVRGGSVTAANTDYGLKKLSFNDTTLISSHELIFSHENPSLAEQDANGTNGITRLNEDGAGDLWAVHCLNLVIFGGGKYVAVIIFWIIISVCANILDFATAIVNVPNTTLGIIIVYVVYYFSCVFAALANFYFGWRWLRHDNFEITIHENCNTVKARLECRRVFNKIAIIVVSFVIIYVTAFMYVTISQQMVTSGYSDSGNFLTYAWLEKHRTYAWIQIMLISFAGTLYFFTVFYLCGSWVWLCWLKVNVSKALAESVTCESIVDKTFMESFIGIYFSNTSISDRWNSNHIIRVVTCIISACYVTKIGFILLEGTLSTIGFFCISTGTLYFAVVWITIVAGGYVNDNSYRVCVTKIATLKYISTSENQQGEKNFEECRLNILQRMAVISSISGIKFAGIHLTTQKAIAVGSVLFTLMTALAK